MLFTGQSLSWICGFMTFMSGFDRYLAVFYPYFYESWCTNNRWFYYMLNVSTCVFAIGIVIWSLQEVGFKPTLYQSGSIPILIGISYYTHLRIMCAISRIHKETLRITARRPCHSAGDQEKYNTGGANPITASTTTKPRKRAVNRRAHRVTFIMLGVWSLSYAPYFVVMLIWQVRAITTNLRPTTTQYSLASASVIPIFYKPLFSPLIYLYTMPTIRKKILHILRLKKRQIST